MENGDLILVKALLEHPRIDLSDRPTLGYSDIVEVIISNPKTSYLLRSEMFLRELFIEAVISSRARIVQLLIAEGRLEPRTIDLGQLLKDVSKSCSIETIQVLLSHPQVDVTIECNCMLRSARKMDRHDVVELLLSYPEVRELDEIHQARRMMRMSRLR